MRVQRILLLAKDLYLFLFSLGMDLHSYAAIFKALFTCIYKVLFCKGKFHILRTQKTHILSCIIYFSISKQWLLLKTENLSLDSCIGTNILNIRNVNDESPVLTQIMTNLNIQILQLKLFYNGVNIRVLLLFPLSFFKQIFKVTQKQTSISSIL